MSRSDTCVYRERPAGANQIKIGVPVAAGFKIRTTADKLPCGIPQGVKKSEIKSVSSYDAEQELMDKLSRFWINTWGCEVVPELLADKISRFGRYAPMNTLDITQASRGLRTEENSKT